MLQAGHLTAKRKKKTERKPDIFFSALRSHYLFITNEKKIYDTTAT